MAELVKGDVVIVAFPFSDLSRAKKRPALVLSSPVGDDVILCQITSRPYQDAQAIALTGLDFENGGLPLDSFIRPHKLFSVQTSIIQSVAGRITKEKYAEVIRHIVAIISQAGSADKP